MIKRLRLKKDIPTPYGRKLKGDIININCDSSSMPTDKFWRDRLRDSAVDNCVELIGNVNKKRKDNGKRTS